MANFLDENGVLYLWQKVKTHLTDKLGAYLTETKSKELFATKDTATTSTNGLMSSTDKAKVNGIPSNPKYTDTTYDVFTTSANGLVPATGELDMTKIKLLAPNGTWSEFGFNVDNAVVGGSAGYDGATVQMAFSHGHILFGGKHEFPSASSTQHGTMPPSMYDKVKAIPANPKYTDTTYTPFVGATESSDGAQGLVPKPLKSDLTARGFLCADGTWKKPLYSLNKTADITKVSLYALSDMGYISGVDIEAASASVAGVMTSDMFTKLNALPTNATLESTYAKKSDITSLYKYKGSVADASKLPTNASTGDVYDIQAASTYGAAGCNVAWNGTAWDSLGGAFSVSAVTNAQLDSICV